MEQKQNGSKTAGREDKCEDELRFEFQIVVVVTCMGIVDNTPDWREMEMWRR
jgi:hypothetical protein